MFREILHEAEKDELFWAGVRPNTATISEHKAAVFHSEHQRSAAASPYLCAHHFQILAVVEEVLRTFTQVWVLMLQNVTCYIVSDGLVQWFQSFYKLLLFFVKSQKSNKVE